MSIISNAKSFLFENKTIRQTIFKNTFWIGLSSSISKFLRAVLIIYVARVLGPTAYGEFAFAFAFVSLFVTFFDVGLSSIVTREFSRDRNQEKEFSSILSLRILLGLGTISLILIGSFFITQDPGIQKVIWILAFFSFASHLPEIGYAFIRARQKMEYEAFTNVLQVLLLTGLVFFIIFNFPSIQNISYGYLISALIALVVFLIIFHFRFYTLKLSFKAKIWKSFLLMSWPLALTSVFGLIYSYIDSIMMGSLGQIIQTGWYNASFKIINVILVPTGIISLSFYPVLSKFSRGAEEKLQKVWNYQVGIMIFLAFPVVIGGLVLAPKIIDFLYGSIYSSAILAFQILILMAGLSFFLPSFSQALIVADQQKKTFLVTFAGAVINIILNIILIPKFSLYGAAVATVVTYLFMFLLYFAFVYKFTPIKPLNFKVFLISLATILSVGIMYLVISLPQVYGLHVIFSVLIGMIIYSSAFFIIKLLIINRLFINN